MAVAISLVFNAILLVTIYLLIADRQKRDRAADRADIVNAQERQQLLDRIMYLSGHAWTPPPSYDEPDHTPEPDPELEPYHFTDRPLNIV